MYYLRRAFVMGMLCLLIPAIVPAQQSLQKVESNIDKRVNNGTLVGISVGYVNAEGKASYLSKGLLAASGEVSVDHHIIFEIGSVTKLFTSLAVAKLVQEKNLSLDTKAELLLPEGFQLPAYKETAITLEHLVTHTSGLPKIPGNLKMKNPAQPYAGYSESDLKEFLLNYELTRKPGSKFAYSNIGMALVGYILEEQTGLTYGRVIERYITDPLKMERTGITVGTKDSSSVAIGHRGGAEVPSWDLTVFEGAGALHSTSADMVKFLRTQMGLVSTLERPVQMMQRPLFDTDEKQGKMQDKVAMGWFYATKSDTILWHNGATGGYKSFIGYNIEDETGVVLLSNSTNSISDIGFYLLDEGGYPLNDDVSLSKEELQKFVGEYRAGPGATFYITRTNDQLYVRLTGQNKLPIYPKSETRFYLKAVPAEIQFEVTADSAEKLILFQNGRKTPANRVVAN